MNRIIRVIIQIFLYQNKNLLSVFVLVQRILNYYPNYPTRRLYFGEVETPYTKQPSRNSKQVHKTVHKTGTRSAAWALTGCGFYSTQCRTRSSWNLPTKRKKRTSRGPKICVCRTTLDNTIWWICWGKSQMISCNKLCDYNITKCELIY